MKKERLFYLDFVRAMATLLIVLAHFNAVFIWTMPEKIVITATVGGIYIGDVGVYLFLIISGAALMHVYRERLPVAEFYKKRFLSIYPMFWIAFVGCFLIQFYINRGIPQGIPKYKIIESILAVDRYTMLFGSSNFSIVGEWFLGFIILFYLIFPLLRKWMIASPVSLCVVTVSCWIACAIWKVPHYEETLPALLPGILFGMYFSRGSGKVKWPVAAGGLGAIIVCSFMPYTWEDTSRSLVVAVSIFLIFVWCSEYIRWIPFRRICAWVCKYSYAIFIIHHVIILWITTSVDLTALSRGDVWLLFLFCCCVIFIAAYFLKFVHDGILGFFIVRDTKKQIAENERK